MTITYVENVRIPSGRAHSYQIVQTCAGLARLGHTLTLLTPARTTEDTFTAHGMSPSLFRHERLKCLDPLSGRKRFMVLAYATQRFFFVRALRKRVKTISSDIWYTRDPAMIDGLRSVAGPWVLELHDAPSDLTRWERVKPRITHFVGISEGVKAWLREQGIPKANITVAQDGFDPALFTNLPTRADARQAFGLPHDAFVALYTGSCYPWKGVDLVVKAWAQTPPSAHLVIAGGAEDDLTRLRSHLQATPAHVRERIHFLKAMPREAVVRLFPLADIGILPTSPDHEIGRRFTSPLKLFEYLAAGLPVLASDVPSSHDILTPDVGRFFEYTEEAFANAVTTLVADADWRKTAVARAPEVAKPYSWDERAKRIRDALIATPHTA